MDTAKEFQILVRRKIPYISEGLWIVVGSLFLLACFFYLFMLPTKKASDEMATVYYIFVMPYWLKKLFAIAFAGLIIFIPMYFVARVNQPGSLTVSHSNILIKGRQLNLAIPLKNIKKIYFNDLKNLLRQPKYKMQIVIQEKSSKCTVFLLANYGDAEDALDTLSKITDAEFAFYDDNMLTTHDDE
jgi:hypothetical protein